MADDLFDFGFTTAEEMADELGFKARVEQAEKDGRDSTKRIAAMLDAIEPLLQNLEQNPDSDYIKWPGKERIAAIDAFRRKLHTISIEGTD